MTEKFPTRPWQAVAAVALIQCAILAYMVWDRVHLLRAGDELVLDVVPVDPRSIFRGDYVILAYDVSNVDGHLVHGSFDRNDVLYVTIAKDAEGRWKPVAAASSRPKATKPGEFVLKGRADRDIDAGETSKSPLRVRYGIESYFVPEGTGIDLEKQVRERKIAALVAVDRAGNSAIKGLKVDGETVYEEAPF